MCFIKLKMELNLKNPMPMMFKKETKHLLTAPFDKICRTCMNLEEQIFNIFEVTCKDVNLSEVFANYIAVQVERNDGLPQHVCGLCIARFIEMYGFIQQCEHADVTLRTELNNRSKLAHEINEKVKMFIDDVGSSQCSMLPEVENSLAYEDNEKVVPFLEEAQKEIHTEAINSQINIDTFCPENSAFFFIDPDSETDSKENISHVFKSIKKSDSDIETNEDLQNDDFITESFCESPPMKGYHVIEPCAFRFSCKRCNCNKYFDSLIKLKEHRKLEHPLPRNHVCVKCNKAVSSYHNLQLHVKKCEKTDFPVQHNENLESKPSELLEKLLEASNFPFTVYSCRKCNKFYDSQDGLKMHRKQVKHSRTHNYVCPKCSKTVSSMYNLKEHMKTHTKEELSPFDLNLDLYTCIAQGDQNEPSDGYFPTKLEPDESSDSFLSTLTPIAEDDQNDNLSKLLKQLLRSDKSSNTFHGCKHCNLVFASYDEFTLHQKEMNHSKIRNFNHVCPVCSKKCDRPSSLKQHMITHTKEKPYSCEVCQMRFSMKFNLRRHMMTHTDERPYVCEFCDKGFIQADCLAEHVRVKHTGETPFECSYCGKHFARRMSYQTHLKTHRIKSDESPETSTNNETNEMLKCNVCQREFRSTGCLKQHMALHEEKSFLCSHCGKSFALQNGLLSHMKVHTGVKPHSCTMCDKTFSHMESLKCHLRTHTGEKPFVCKICSKSFRQSAHLMYHMRMHNMEKSYKCTYCEKSFITNGNLTAHKRIHTGETPFVCDVCGKGFYHSNNLKKHKQVHGKSNEGVNLVTKSSIVDAAGEEPTN